MLELIHYNILINDIYILNDQMTKVRNIFSSLLRMFWLYNPGQKSLKFEIDEILCFYKICTICARMAYRTLIIAVNVIFGIINEYICIFSDFCNRW